MGPLYHLTLRENRLKALRESVVRLKPGGIFVSTMISRFGILADLLQRTPAWIEDQKDVRSVVELGRGPKIAADGEFHG
jgi:hypothetical protein